MYKTVIEMYVTRIYVSCLDMTYHYYLRVFYIYDIFAWLDFDLQIFYADSKYYV